MSKKGFFIALEGTEGAGKSTQREFIGDYLRLAGIPVVFTREPGGTPLAEEVREILLRPRDEAMSNKTELLLMFAARAQHVEQVIKPFLEQGAFVLCDRFIDSTYAYQCFGRKVPREEIDTLVQFSIGDLRPDLTILLDLPHEVGMQRISVRGKLDRFELMGQAFFARVASGYRAQYERDPGRYAKLDANRTIEEIQADLSIHLDELIEQYHSQSTVENQEVRA